MGKIVGLVRALFTKLDWARDVPLLLLRVSVGYVFFLTGKGKLMNLDAITDQFREWGIPAAGIQAPFASAVECLGGLMVLVGLATRIISIPLAFMMAVAITYVKWSDVESLSDFLSLDEWLYLCIFFGLVFFGPGRVSVDHLLSRTVFKASETTLPKEPLDG